MSHDHGQDCKTNCISYIISYVWWIINCRHSSVDETSPVPCHGRGLEGKRALGRLGHFYIARYGRMTAEERAEFNARFGELVE